MHSTRHIRNTFAAFALAASLLLPQVALAASSSGDTPETLAVAASISARFPLSATYSPNDPDHLFSADNSFYITNEQVVEIVASNAPNGLTLSATAEDFTGPVTVSVTNRQAIASGYSAIGSGAQLVPSGNPQPGDFATTSTVRILATADAPLLGRQVGFSWAAPKSAFPIAGTYTSMVHYTASTNP